MSAPRRGRPGLTLVEVVIAVVIAGGAMLSIGHFMLLFSRTTNEARYRALAAELAAERVEAARSAPSYAALDTFARTEVGLAVAGRPELAAYTRRTYVQLVGGGATDSLNYRIVTVSVTGPGLKTPVRRTGIVADF